MDLRHVRLYQQVKQNLAPRVPASGARALLRDHLGLHSTDYLTPYLSLRARVKDFEPAAFFDDLNRLHSAVRLRAFRGTVFIVHRRNIPLILGGLRSFHASVMAQIEKLSRKQGFDLKRAERIILLHLAGRNRMTAGELNKAVIQSLGLEARPGLLPFFLRYLEFKGLVVRTGQKHINDHVIPYGLLKDWLPEAARRPLETGEALHQLARSYIRKFGPVCLADLCWWLPVSRTEGRRVVEGLKAELEFCLFHGREYMMDRSDLARFKRFAPAGGAPRVVFLPYEDHFPKAYAVRDWFLPAEAEPLLFQKGVTERGQIRPSIWLDGEAIGRWEMDCPARGGSPTKVKIVGLIRSSRFPRKTLAAIEDERRRLEQFLNRKLLPLAGAKEES